MRRREFISLFPAATATAMALPEARAQSANKTYRVVIIAPTGQFGDTTGRDPWTRLADAFVDGLKGLGYTDGRTVRVEGYSAEGDPQRIEDIATRVLRDPVDVIVAAGGGANEVTTTLKRLTRTVPIVMANSSDPVEQGLVASLARPGGNITGFAGNTGPEFEAKRLQLLREVAPGATRLAYLGLKIDWESPAGVGVRAAAAELGMAIVHAEHVASNYTDAFAVLGRERPQGLFVARNPRNFSNRQSITELAAGFPMVAVYPTREFTEIGGLMSYGPLLTDLYRRVAGHVDKILRGAKPAEMPVEQPTKFELLINLKTATKLGIAIPPLVLIRADEVIE